MHETRVCRDPEIMLGQPVIRGTRLTVAFILRCLANMDMKELLEQYPFLTKEDVMAALACAAEVLEDWGRDLEKTRTVAGRLEGLKEPGGEAWAAGKGGPG